MNFSGLAWYRVILHSLISPLGTRVIDLILPARTNVLNNNCSTTHVLIFQRSPFMCPSVVVPNPCAPVRANKFITFWDLVNIFLRRHCKHGFLQCFSSIPCFVSNNSCFSKILSLTPWLMLVQIVSLGGLGVPCSPRDPRFAGCNPTVVDGFFQDVKILSTSPPGGTLS